MKKIITVLSITILLFILVGCGEETKKTEETFRTVSFFDNHKVIRDLRISECKKLNTMTKIIEKDCSNAKTSQIKDSKGKSIDWSKMPRRYKKD